jgi:hypothetical protein
MTDEYLEVIPLIERLHRHFLEVVKLELDGLGIYDINNVQGMMLFNIGDAEMTVGELTLRGCYLGSNVSYNLKKMVDNGYVLQERSVHDRRSSHVRLAIFTGREREQRVDRSPGNGCSRRRGHLVLSIRPCALGGSPDTPNG